MNDGPKTGLDAVLALVAVVGYAAFVAIAFVNPRGEAQSFSGANTAEATSAVIPAIDVELEPSGRVGIESVVAGPPGFTPPMEILVKFEGDRGERLRDLFLDDPVRAKAAFDEFAAGRAAFKDLELKLLSFGGEATLEYIGAAPDAIAARIAMQREIARALRDIEGVTYAEPNLIAGMESDSD